MHQCVNRGSNGAAWHTAAGEGTLALPTLNTESESVCGCEASTSTTQGRGKLQNFPELQDMAYKKDYRQGLQTRTAEVAHCRLGTRSTMGTLNCCDSLLLVKVHWLSPPLALSQTVCGCEASTSPTQGRERQQNFPDMVYGKDYTADWGLTPQLGHLVTLSCCDLFLSCSMNFYYQPLCGLHKEIVS